MAEGQGKDPLLKSAFTVLTSLSKIQQEQNKLKLEQAKEDVKALRELAIAREKKKMLNPFEKIAMQRLKEQMQAKAGANIPGYGGDMKGMLRPGIMRGGPKMRPFATGPRAGEAVTTYPVTGALPKSVFETPVSAEPRVEVTATGKPKYVTKKPEDVMFERVNALLKGGLPFEKLTEDEKRLYNEKVGREEEGVNRQTQKQLNEISEFIKVGDIRSYEDVRKIAENNRNALELQGVNVDYILEKAKELLPETAPPEEIAWWEKLGGLFR